MPPGYYPVPGAAPGTICAWDGRTWHPPVTAPGFYPSATGPIWWNGGHWTRDVRAPGPTHPADIADTDRGAVPATDQVRAAPRPLSRRPTRVHRRRRRHTTAWHRAGATMMVTALVLMTTAMVVGLHHA